MQWTPGERYDFVAMVATLHHLPFPEALTRAATLLNPGGVLAVLGLDRPPSLLHAGARAALAWPVSAAYRLRRGALPVDAVTVEPSMTLEQIRRAARAILPDAEIRPRLLWRYTLFWTRPNGGQSGP